MNTNARFLQIHWLASYPATLLNRDEAGLAKRMPFGGDTRSRISSQCLKRHWRLAGQDTLEQAKQHPWALGNVGVPMGIRSKEIVADRIMKLATEDLPVSDELQSAVQDVLLKSLYGKNAADAKKRQALFFGQPEIDYLASKTRRALETGDAKVAAAQLEHFFSDERKNLNALRDGAGLESALFGRMMTSDPAANRDGTIHVAHALSVHPMERELDFMTVVDDLKSESVDADSGAAGVFDMELVSGLYYGYVVVDVELLVSNLSGDRAAAARVVEHLVHLIADVSPGAKKGSTAPYTYAELMLVEAGRRQPRTLANAFRKAIPLKGGDIGERAAQAMGDYLQRVDAAYGEAEQRRQLSVLEVGLPGVEVVNLGALATFAANHIEASTP